MRYLTAAKRAEIIKTYNSYFVFLLKITPICLMIGHTSVVNCLAKAGSSKDEEYIVSSSENGYDTFFSRK